MVAAIATNASANVIKYVCNCWKNDVLHDLLFVKVMFRMHLAV